MRSGPTVCHWPSVGPADQSLYSGPPAAAAHSALSFPLDVKGEQRQAGKGRTEESRRGRKVRWEAGTEVRYAVRSCLIRTLDLPQTDRERDRGRLSWAKIEVRQRWAKGQKMRQKSLGVCGGGGGVVGRQRRGRSHQAGIEAPIKIRSTDKQTPWACPGVSWWLTVWDEWETLAALWAWAVKTHWKMTIFFVTVFFPPFSFSFSGVNGGALTFEALLKLQLFRTNRLLLIWCENLCTYRICIATWLWKAGRTLSVMKSDTLSLIKSWLSRRTERTSGVRQGWKEWKEEWQ